MICYHYMPSPFILNYVIKHRLNKFIDEWSEMLKNNFYADNLVKTSNLFGKLLYLYLESFFLVLLTHLDSTTLSILRFLFYMVTIN